MPMAMNDFGWLDWRATDQGERTRPIEMVSISELKVLPGPQARYLEIFG